MKITRNLLALFLFFAAVAACDSVPTGPGHDDSPAIGSGTGT